MLIQLDFFTNWSNDHTDHVRTHLSPLLTRPVAGCGAQGAHVVIASSCEPAV